MPSLRQFSLLVVKKGILAIVLASLCSAAGAQYGNPDRKIACKTPAVAHSCSRVHARLTFCCGTPAVRLWEIGTHRVLGIYSGPASYDATKGEVLDGDNENPSLPSNIREAASRFKTKSGVDAFPAIFGDFEVCPLEPHRPGVMQAACIESARNLKAK